MSKKVSLPIDIPFFSGMYKGILSIVLALVLIFDPDKSAPKLTYIMGMFFLTSGIALLRNDPSGKLGKRLSKLISAVAIVSGLLVVVRYFSNSIFGLHVVSDNFANVVLGAVILLTGISHFYAEWEARSAGLATSHLMLHYLLALFEIALGLQLMVLPMVDHLFVRQTITAWALLGGIMFISTAFVGHRQRRQAKLAEGMDSPADSAEDDSAAAAGQEDAQKSVQQNAGAEKTS